MIVHSLDRIRKCASEKCALIGEVLNVVATDSILNCLMIINIVVALHYIVCQ